MVRIVRRACRFGGCSGTFRSRAMDLPTSTNARTRLRCNTALSSQSGWKRCAGSVRPGWKCRRLRQRRLVVDQKAVLTTRTAVMVYCAR